MLVAFDTTAFVADFQMTGNAWRVFLAGFRRVGLVPCLAELVQDEVTNQYREKFEGIAQKAEKLQHEARRVLGLALTHGLPTAGMVDVFMSEYRARLINRLVEDDFEVLRYPAVSHKEMVARDLLRRRPFHENGTGYRDALLWEAILEHLQAHPRTPITLVTANSHDFGSETLHEDLLADLDRLGVPRASVQLVSSLEQLNHKMIVPTLERLDALRDGMLDGTGPFSLRAWVAESLHELLRDEEGLGPLEPGHGSCRVRKVETIRRLRVDAVRQAGPDSILVGATAHVTVDMDVDAEWDDYVRHKDVREFFRGDDESPFARVSTTTLSTITVAFSLVLSSNTVQVESCELDSCETEEGVSWELNPHVSDE